MTDEIRVVIDGPPVAKGRPRMTRTGHTYTPDKTRAYEDHGRVMAQLAMAGRDPFDGPVNIKVVATMPIPESWSKKKKNDALTGVLRHTTSPDLDNLVKAATDSLNGIVFRDDRQIDSISAMKTYGTKPCTVIEVSMS